MIKQIKQNNISKNLISKEFNLSLSKVIKLKLLMGNAKNTTVLKLCIIPFLIQITNIFLINTLNYTKEYTVNIQIKANNLIKEFNINKNEKLHMLDLINKTDNFLPNINLQTLKDIIINYNLINNSDFLVFYLKTENNIESFPYINFEICYNNKILNEKNFSKLISQINFYMDKPIKLFWD